MRHDQADKPDRARPRHSCTSKQGDQQDPHRACSHDVDAEGVRDVIAQVHHVHPVRRGERSHQADQYDRGDGGDDVHVPARDGARRPKPHVIEALRAGEHDAAGQRGTHRPERGPAEYNRDRGGTAASRAQCEDERYRHCRAEETDPHRDQHRQRAEHGGCCSHRKRRPRGDAQQVCVSQRVARVPLEQSSRCA